LRGAEITLLELEIDAHPHEAMLFPAADSCQEPRIRRTGVRMGGFIAPASRESDQTGIGSSPLKNSRYS
jgi:hypothetical protein